MTNSHTLVDACNGDDRPDCPIIDGLGNRRIIFEEQNGGIQRMNLEDYH